MLVHHRRGKQIKKDPLQANPPNPLKIGKISPKKAIFPKNYPHPPPYRIIYVNRWIPPLTAHYLITLQACFLGHHNIVQRLCQVENIDVNFLDDDGYSALLLSVWNNHVDVVEALKMVKNVDWNVQSYKGKVREVEVEVEVCNI